MFKPLLRTLPSLTGNIKLACEINDYVDEGNNVYSTYIRSASLQTLQNNLYNRCINLSKDYLIEYIKFAKAILSFMLNNTSYVPCLNPSTIGVLVEFFMYTLILENAESTYCKLFSNIYSLFILLDII